ncbi:MAG: SRPBCC family protein [Cephaloticoccus sp.]|nr:SRPBCC family protein [Cephaloticoccus sp.]MCF7761139.1 SRPBCC family protein [Cephaloticoccus sp.]
MIHSLAQSQFVAADHSRVWDFFSTPHNLNVITPPEMRFQIKGDPGPMHEGQLISYRIRVAPAIWVNWLTEIRHIERGRRFVDEQRLGPYRFWYHEHTFEPGDGGVLMHDHVTYALPFGPLGDLVHAFWVRRQLRHIFEYRCNAVDRIFGVGP